jgi:hypothetical protein
VRKAISTGEYDRAAGIQYQPGIPKSETNPEILGLDYAVTDARELAIARADSMILSGNPQAIPYARYAWTLSPRVPRSAELLKASMLKSRPQEIACYASVMAWLAPELATYWQGMRQEAIAAGAKPDLEVSAVLKKFTTILDDLDEKEEQRMWMTTVPPFLPEYMVMPACSCRECRSHRPMEPTSSTTMAAAAASFGIQPKTHVDLRFALMLCSTRRRNCGVGEYRAPTACVMRFTCSRPSASAAQDGHARKWDSRVASSSSESSEST